MARGALEARNRGGKEHRSRGPRTTDRKVSSRAVRSNGRRAEFRPSARARTRSVMVLRRVGDGFATSPGLRTTRSPSNREARTWPVELRHRGAGDRRSGSGTRRRTRPRDRGVLNHGCPNRPESRLAASRGPRSIDRTSRPVRCPIAIPFGTAGGPRRPRGPAPAPSRARPASSRRPGREPCRPSPGKGTVAWTLNRGTSADWLATSPGNPARLRRSGPPPGSGTGPSVGAERRALLRGTPGT